MITTKQIFQDFLDRETTEEDNDQYNWNPECKDDFSREELEYRIAEEDHDSAMEPDEEEQRIFFEECEQERIRAIKMEGACKLADSAIEEFEHVISEIAGENSLVGKTLRSVIGHIERLKKKPIF